MKILTDIHCHTIASDHAYSTVAELAAVAKERGMEAIAVTDHGIGMDDAPHIWHFQNLKAIPREIAGVKILYGCEANILNSDGDLDMDDYTLGMLDIVIASIHYPSCFDRTQEDQTKAYLKVLENPHVDVLGHSGNPKLLYDIDKVLLRAKELHKMIEINAHTFEVRKQNVKRCREIAARCKELGVSICVNSDAHICFDIGIYTPAVQMLRELDFPQELIANRSFEALAEFLKPRKEICR